MAVATLAYLGCWRRLSTWYLVPQQLILFLSAFGQTKLMIAGHYADWVIRSSQFIFRDQAWGILLSLFHLAGILLIANFHKPMSKLYPSVFIRYPFETGVAAYTIINALLTFSPDSAVLSNLWQLIGGYSLIAVCYQLFAAVSILYGMVSKKLNVEIMGLIMLCSVFAIRAVALLTDQDITISDLNSSTLAGVLIVSSATRIYRLISRSWPYQI